MSVKSCTMFAVQAEGADITTMSIADADGSLSALQEGFRMMHQAAMRLLHARHDLARAAAVQGEPRRLLELKMRMGISGDFCRCTSYQNIVKAIQYAAAKINGVQFQKAR